jgi:hypothetical protein
MGSHEPDICGFDRALSQGDREGESPQVETVFSLVVAVWSGAGSNRRPSAFQVNHAKRYADLEKRTSLTSGTALGGRCSNDASRTQ